MPSMLGLPLSTSPLDVDRLESGILPSGRATRRLLLSSSNAAYIRLQQHVYTL